MNEKVKKALDLLEHLRKATLDTDIDEMGGLVLTDESYFENEINELKDIVNDFDRYYESQQDLIKGKDEYIAKLCNDRAELKELREFIKIIFANFYWARWFRWVQECKTCEEYNSIFVENAPTRLTQSEFELVKKVVEKYASK